ncbi:MAG: inositol monophosphatase family protein [Candidatus Woesearchaeota archaeon]|jgi:myo-inositol-1(or 4)-monophosphatase
MIDPLQILQERALRDQILNREISWVKERLSELPSTELLQTYRPREEWFYRRNQDHGILHETRVLVLAELMGRVTQTTAEGKDLDLEAIRWAAITHDTKRSRDGHEFEHGTRAAQWIRTELKESGIAEQVDLEKVAYLNHWHVPPDALAPRMTLELALFKDADGLDRQRVNEFNPRYLRTEPSRNLIRAAHYLIFLSEALHRQGKDEFQAGIEAAELLGIVSPAEGKRTGTKRVIKDRMEDDPIAAEPTPADLTTRETTLLEPTLRMETTIYTNSPVLTHLQKVALQAGEVMLKGRRDGFERYNKGGSVVTSVDLAITDLVRDYLSKQLPSIVLLTEESEDNLDRLQEKEIIIIDEMDGSGSFARGGDDFSFMGAQVVNGRVVSGVIYEPHRDRMFFAQAGKGAYLTQKGLTTRLTLAPSTTFGFKVSHSANHYNGIGEIFKALDIGRRRVIESESMGTMMTKLALQQAQLLLVYSSNLKQWDVAAGDILLREMGYDLMNTQGGELRYNQKSRRMKEGIVMVHPDIRSYVLKHLPED